MKMIVKMAVLLVSITHLVAQESFLVYLHGANVVPPNHSPHVGRGEFTLDGNVLNYGVGIGFSFFPTGAGIYGPALPGQNAPRIFDWSHYVIFPPVPGDEHGGGQGGGIAYIGGYILTSEQTAQLKAGLWYVLIKSDAFPNGELRGQICPATPGSDCDFDGVPNSDDLCDNTKPNDAVDADGCSIEQLVPCNDGWKNHREYVKAVREQAFRFWKEGRIGVAQRNKNIKSAEASSCGEPVPPPGPGAFPGPG